MMPETTKRNLVGATADRLRDMVFAAEPDSLIGSLQDLAKALEVGIVTLQQAARILEHEGLLEGRRGPGGGFYGMRPGPAAVARSLGAYLRSNPTSFEEAVNITSLLFNELVPAAADCADVELREQLAQLSATLPDCTSDGDCGVFEEKFQDLLFRMVESPLFKLLTVVTLRVGVSKQARLLRGGEGAVTDWRDGRQRIIAAILKGDRELARFEADRSNRRVILNGIQDQRQAAR